MQRRQFLSTGIGTAVGLTALRADAPRLQWRQRLLLGLGTTLSLRAAHENARQLEAGLDAAVAAIRRVEASMSLFNDRSELATLNRQGYLDSPSPELRTVLRTALLVAQHSGGQFDPTVQPLWLLYAQAQREGRLPSPGERAQVRERIGWQHVAMGDAGIALQKPGMALTLNGIAQGYAADLAKQTLVQHGIAHALIDAGEFACLGQNLRQQPWILGVEDPRNVEQVLADVPMGGRSVATSSDHRSAFSMDLLHHHILDPATGDSPPVLSSVTVLAPSATLADALTKVMFISGPHQIEALARKWRVDVLWVEKTGRWHATSGIRLV
jgi:thiamine biosynthesis lipoprotein